MPVTLADPGHAPQLQRDSRGCHVLKDFLHPVTRPHTTEFVAHYSDVGGYGGYKPDHEFFGYWQSI